MAAAINNIPKHLTITAQDWKDTQRYCTCLSQSVLWSAFNAAVEKKERKKTAQAAETTGRYVSDPL